MDSILSFSSKIVIFLITIYQKLVSPFLGNHCRFKISCSEYSIETIKKLGLIKGSYYSFKRILSCHPLYFHN
ncbi:membrane protein insertion efficiency factor YidD [Candidatus Riesia pediculicola]|uniref:Protein YidD n=1 Tax=Riesia pediculicola (strain USDA) TaxID=515618 RepID=D4G7W5_RIEPU|nr:membrane protein insertion efficiency factor YidD [Candidatus Riesia pediculicola]ADD79572.1 protein YidD [Candidatus Riesia pediculicola USDA]QOJ86327.1 membrane protein insertion efficiency factor YidD [Candidatus Riesia pediculicola]